MTTVINPLDHESAYDVLVVAGKRSPGKVTLSGHDRSFDWDVKKVQGQKGASTTFQGDTPTEFTATFELVRDESLGVDDLEEWPAFQGLIESAIAGPTPKALDIYHPDLVRNRITTVVPKKIGGAVHDGMGGQMVTITFLEFRPPKPAGGALRGTKKKNPDPDQALLDEIASLTDTYKRTPWG